MHRDGSRNSPLAQCAACVGVVCVGKEFAVAFFDIASSFYIYVVSENIS